MYNLFNIINFLFIYLHEYYVKYFERLRLFFFWLDLFQYTFKVDNLSCTTCFSMNNLTYAYDVSVLFSF